MLWESIKEIIIQGSKNYSKELTLPVLNKRAQSFYNRDFKLIIEFNQQPCNLQIGSLIKIREVAVPLKWRIEKILNLGSKIWILPPIKLKETIFNLYNQNFKLQNTQMLIKVEQEMQTTYLTN